MLPVCRPNRGSYVVGFISNVPTDGAIANTIDVGVSFINIGSEDGSYTITDKLFDTQVNNGDACLVFNPTAYNYDWYQYADDIGTGEPGWMIMDMVTYATTFVTSFVANGGDDIIFYPMNALTEVKATISGEVADMAGASRTFICDPASTDAELRTMPFANPYPVATTMEMLEGFAVNGDALLVWNSAAYNYDWYQYSENYDGAGNPAWMVMDMITYATTFKTEMSDVILEAGCGAIFMPATAGTRIWTVSLDK